MAEATESSPRRLVPPAGSSVQRQQQQQQATRQKQIAKLRRENIFPNVAMACLPTVKSSVQLLHDLNTGGFSKDELDRMEKRELGAIRRAEDRCRPFKTVLDSTKVRLHGKARSSGAGAASITREDKELLSIREMNWRYCLAEHLCPERMERLRWCWTTHGRELLSQAQSQSQSQSQSTPTVCNEERKAVERCAGMKVQAALRSSFE